MRNYDTQMWATRLVLLLMHAFWNLPSCVNQNCISGSGGGLGIMDSLMEQLFVCWISG